MAIHQVNVEIFQSRPKWLTEPLTLPSLEPPHYKRKSEERANPLSKLGYPVLIFLIRYPQFASYIHTCCIACVTWNPGIILKPVLNQPSHEHGYDKRDKRVPEGTWTTSCFLTSTSTMSLALQNFFFFF